MSRYIDADALVEQLKDERDFYKKMYDCMQQPCEQDERAIIGVCYTAYSKCCHMVKHAPTVDAVPVVHGEWIEKWRFKPNGAPYHKIGDMECSVCHSDMLGGYYSRYCPHCVATMDGKENDK